MAPIRRMARTLDVRPVTPVVGAEIHNVDLSQPISSELAIELRDAFLAHGVIFFRNQNITPAKHVEFAKLFGVPDRHPIVKGLDEYPEVLEILKESGEKTRFGETWHSDNSYMAEPSLGSILVAREVPEVGNDTAFACLEAVYDSFSPGMKSMLSNLKAVHSASAAFSVSESRRANFDGNAKMKYNESELMYAETLHPVVRTHPETGRKSLYVNSMFTLRFDGMTEHESKGLLEFLFSQVTRPEVQCRFRWAQGSIAMWDNRRMQHVAIGDNPGARRRMQRVTLQGSKPE